MDRRSRKSKYRIDGAALLDPRGYGESSEGFDQLAKLRKVGLGPALENLLPNVDGVEAEGGGIASQEVTTSTGAEKVSLVGPATEIGCREDLLQRRQNDANAFQGIVSHVVTESSVYQVLEAWS